MNIRIVTSTEAQNQFGKLIEDAKREPVMIQKNGRDQVVILSCEEYAQLTTNTAKSTLFNDLHKRSIERRREVYEALAK